MHVTPSNGKKLPEGFDSKGSSQESMSVRQYAPTPTKTLTRTDNRALRTSSGSQTSESSDRHYFSPEGGMYNPVSASGKSYSRSNAGSRATAVSGWGWASPSSQYARTPVPPSRTPQHSQGSGGGANGARYLRHQQFTQTPPSSSSSVNESKRRRKEKRAKRPGGKNERAKQYGRLRTQKKRSQKVQYQQNDYVHFPRIIVAVEGPGNVPGIAKDVADFMGWLHISLEDLLIYSDDPVCGDAITNIAQGIPVNVQTL